MYCACNYGGADVLGVACDKDLCSEESVAVIVFHLNGVAGPRKHFSLFRVLYFV